MPESSALPISTGEVAPPWRRFVAERVAPRFHPKLRRAISASVSRSPDEPPMVVAVLGPGASGKTTLLHVVRRTLIACGAIGRVAMDDDGVFFAGVDAGGIRWTTRADGGPAPGLHRIEVHMTSTVGTPIRDFYTHVGTLDVLTWLSERGVTRG